MADIDQEIRSFDQMRSLLEQHHTGKFVVIHDGKLEGVYDSLDAAGRAASERFGGGPYLIRQVGAPTSVPLPSSLAYFLPHAAA